MKKNADMIDKLSNKRIHHDARMSEMKESMFTLKSLIGQKNGELKSLVATLLELMEAYFHLKHKYAILAQNCDKLLVKFDTHVEATEVGVDVKELVARAAEQMVAVEQMTAVEQTGAVVGAICTL
ncbi:unnamed protein product [Prunus brigantina]